jgi:hypothetical protein
MNTRCGSEWGALYAKTVLKAFIGRFFAVFVRLLIGFRRAKSFRILSNQLEFSLDRYSTVNVYQTNTLN